MAQEPIVAPHPQGHMQRPADGIDPNVVMPPHVKAAQERAATAFKSAYEPGAQPTGQVQPQPNGQGNVPPNGAAPAAAPAAPPAGQSDPLDNADGSPNWENRFKALKGRYDADARRWNETQEQFEKRIKDAEERVQQATRQPLPGETFDPKNPPRLVTEAEVQEYGADLIDVVRRVAAETVMPMIAPIATKVGQVEGQAQATAKETERQFLNRMHGFMDQNVPGWNDINRDEKFIAWSKEPDVYSGLNRQELLQRAWYAGDAKRVAAFFQGFLAEEAATDPAAAEARQRALAGVGGGHAAPQPASPGQSQAAPRVTLEQLAAPGRARAAVTPPAGKVEWTAEGIASFYQDVAAGKFRGREAERVATEADLMAAQREGRIKVNPRTATHIGR